MEPEDAAPAAVPVAAGGRPRIPRWVLEVVETLALTLVIFLVVQNFVAQPFEVEQHSMEQTFTQGQYVLVDRLSHLWSPYARGQVVVFRPPVEVSSVPDPFIKRVIAVGGDTVDIRDGEVLVNGLALDEPYLYRDADGTAGPTEAGTTDHWVVPQGDLFVMGDHREVSSDSRIFGPIPISSVIGRAILRYWPVTALSLVQAQTSAP